VTGGQRRFVEKTPQHVLVLRHLVHWFPQSHFVHIVRDGRDCFCSAQSHPDVPQRTDVRRFAHYWRRCLLARQTVSGVVSVVDVRYEDLVEQPADTLRQLMSLLGAELLGLGALQCVLRTSAGQAAVVGPLCQNSARQRAWRLDRHGWLLCFY
jgi:hypothetical protein